MGTSVQTRQRQPPGWVQGSWAGSPVELYPCPGHVGHQRQGQRIPEAKRHLPFVTRLLSGRSSTVSGEGRGRRQGWVLPWGSGEEGSLLLPPLGRLLSSQPEGPGEASTEVTGWEPSGIASSLFSSGAAAINRQKNDRVINAWPTLFTA